MKARLVQSWYGIRSSFWFLPALMAAAAVMLALGSVALDHAAAQLGEVIWTFAGGAEGASEVLGTIASSMITIAGVIFSMTLVALTLTTSQFGPRLLRTFMRDTTTQLVLGTFVATFLYCLLVLRSIRRIDDASFVPHLSVTLGVILAVASVGVLIYFIHHIALSIQADEVVTRVSRELNHRIENLFPEHVGHEPPATPSAAGAARLPDGFEREARAVLAARDGYVQSLDANALIAAASEADVVVRVEQGPGSYVVQDRPLASVWPGERLTDGLATRVRHAFASGHQRTPVQDLEFAVAQLVEIAVRALSPSLNDPFTAIRCVDRLGSALCRLARRQMPSPDRFDEQGNLRVVAPAVTFPKIADAAFDPIRAHSGSSVAVTLALLETIAVVAACSSRHADRRALRRHAEMIARGARDGLSEVEDRQAVERRYRAAQRLLAEPASSGP